MNEYQLPDGKFIRRARAWHLYDQTGMRYTDWWQADGRAFLGHRPTGLGKTLKAELDRGVWGYLPTVWSRRLERAIARLSGACGVPVRPVEAWLPSAFAASATAPSAKPSDSLRWYPLEQGPPADVGATSDRAPAGLARPTVRFVLLPVPWLPAGGSVPAATVGAQPTLVVAALAVSADALATYLTSSLAQERLEAAVRVPLPREYRRSGVYMIPSNNAKLSSRVRHLAWNLGIVLPPTGSDRIIVPGELSAYELRQWSKLVDEWSK